VFCVRIGAVPFCLCSVLLQARSEGRVLAPKDLTAMMEQAWAGRYEDSLSQVQDTPSTSVIVDLLQLWSASVCIALEIHMHMYVLVSSK
jgi:hypothetical protein